VKYHTLNEITGFKPQRTTACRKKNRYGRWSAPDKRKNCVGCKLSACGVVFGVFERLATAETTEGKARGVVRGWYRNIPSKMIALRAEASPAMAVEDYLAYVAEVATESTVTRYTAFLGQFVAFCGRRKIQHVRQIDQDDVLEFRKTLEDPEAAHKKASLNNNGKPRWGTMKIGTIRRNARIRSASSLPTTRGLTTRRVAVNSGKYAECLFGG
jgi:hypothetical protein